MNKTEIRTLIEAEIRKTEVKIEGYEEMAAPVTPDSAIGRVSRMDAIVNKSIFETSLQRAKEKLSQLQIMLGRLDEPDFGRCANCGLPIPVKRIVLMPQSKFCVKCSA
ncbi:MAG: TraR/DksA family transcriptional regulator [Bacteroidetes bacterium]|nr:MAG: TraR/DksA family transcriptional regulator [Bacteroidota bacterium]